MLDLLFASWFFLGCAAVVAFPVFVRVALTISRSIGYNRRRVLLLGLSDKAVSVANRLARARWTGFQTVGYIDDRRIPRTAEHGMALLGSVENAEQIVEEFGVSELLIGYPMSCEKRTAEALKALQDSMVAVRYLIEVDAPDASNYIFADMAGIPVLNIHATPLDDRANLITKRVFDGALATVALVLLSPLMLVIATGVKLSSPGPVIYRQRRVGWKKRPFTMLKFRSMPVDAECSSGPTWARRGDGRATPFGAFLRRTSLDELPQLINVLKGEMSIVGPRPERPEFVEQFRHEIPWYMKKHMVKAGITGWAQVHGWRGETDLTQRIKHDLYYIEHWSLWLDLKIVLLTLVKGFVHPHAY